MGRALCICDVAIDARGVAYPTTEDVRKGPNGTFPICWTITSFQDTRRIAIGLAEVSTPQSNDLNNNGTMTIVDLPPGWVTMTWGQIPAQKKTQILNFLTAHGIDSSAFVASMPLPVVVDIVSDQIRPGRRLMHLEMELSMNHGV